MTVDLDLTELGAIAMIAEAADADPIMVADLLDVVAEAQVRQAMAAGIDAPAVPTLRAVAALLIVAIERAHPGTLPAQLVADYADYAPPTPAMYADPNLN